MKRTMTALCVAAAACWVMVGGAQAQSTAGSQGSQSGSMSGSQSSHAHSSKSGETVTLTGCLQSDPSGKGYVLTNVTEGGQASASGEYGSSSSGQTGTSGQTGMTGEQSGTSGTSGSTNTVELVAGKKVDLKAHVGHRVEITGVPSGPSKSKSSMGEGSGSQAGTSGSGGQSGSMSGSSSQGNWAGQKIRVESLRHIADSCSGQ